MLRLELLDPFVRGDDEDVTIVLADANDQPIDLTGRTYRAQLKKYRNDTTPVATFAVEVDPPAGSITMALTREQTAGLDARPHYWMDLEETVADGPRTTIVIAKVPLELDVSR